MTSEADDWASAGVLASWLIVPAAAFVVAGTLVTVVLQILVAKRFSPRPPSSLLVLLVNLVTSPALTLACWFAITEMEGVGLLAKLLVLLVCQISVIWIHKKLYVRSLGTGTVDERGWLKFAVVANTVSAVLGFALYILLAIDQTRAVLLGILG